MSSTNKGRVVELIVKDLYKNALPGSKTKHDVRLPAKNSTKRKRQIDVLLSTEIIGIPIHIVFECKNENRPISIEEVGDFIDKLTDVGIPPQHGIMVSASSFTSGAMERATEVGIQTLRLVGLTPDRLESAVIQAYHSIVYLLAEVSQLAVTNNIEQSDLPGELLTFRDDHGNICGSILDLIWHQWVNGLIPDQLGEHPLTLNIPKHWHYVINCKEEPLEIRAAVHVFGVVLTLFGHGTDHMLVSAKDGTLNKRSVDVKFEDPDVRDPVPMKVASSEQELNDLIVHSNAVNVTLGRFRLPRIKLENAYYPPSERTARILVSLGKAQYEGKIPKSYRPTFEQIEGLDLTEVFEPIWSAHPAMQKNDWTNWINDK